MAKIRFRSKEKEQLVHEVVLPHLNRQVSDHPCVFGFLTRHLTERQLFQAPFISVQRNTDEVKAIEKAAARHKIPAYIDASPGKPARMMWLEDPDFPAFVFRGNILRRHPREMLHTLRTVAQSLSGGSWSGNGVTAIWYDHCGTFENGLRGINRVKFFTNSIIKKVPVCLTFARRHHTPKSVEEANQWIEWPIHDTGLDDALRRARRKNQDFQLKFERIHNYVGDNRANMSIATGWLTR